MLCFPAHHFFIYPSCFVFLPIMLYLPIFSVSRSIFSCSTRTSSSLMPNFSISRASFSPVRLAFSASIYKRVNIFKSYVSFFLNIYKNTYFYNYHILKKNQTYTIFTLYYVCLKIKSIPLKQFWKCLSIYQIFHYKFHYWEKLKLMNIHHMHLGTLNYLEICSTAKHSGAQVLVWKRRGEYVKIIEHLLYL